MSEFRQNFATREWVIIAPERSLRPADIAPQRTSGDALPVWSERCPFCPGNEAITARELHRVGDAAAWSMRVVLNKYAALSMDEAVDRRRVGRFLAAGSHGHAEVLIESPRHNLVLADMDVRAVEELLLLYRRRLAEVSTWPDVAIVMIFRNSGPNAGTSLAHPHSQLIASPIIPPHIRDPLDKAMLHYDTWGSCVYCDLLDEELRQRDRILWEHRHAVALCPFASRTPYEVRIYPRKHNASFIWTGDEEIRGVAELLLKSVRALRDALGDPSYNVLLRSSPVGDEDVRYLHWYFVLVPRISTPAGFEMGSGIYINPIPPEQAAEELRIHG